MSERKVSGIILSAEDAQKQTEQLNEELTQMSNSSHNLQYHTVTIEKDGEFHQIEVPIDDIDLLDDFDDDDLTDEGERSLGIISQDHDSTQMVSAQKTSRQRLPVGKIKLIKKNVEGDFISPLDDFEIVCPFTQSNEVYQISSGVWASYETDQPFRILDEMPLDSVIDEEA